MPIRCRLVVVLTRFVYKLLIKRAFTKKDEHLAYMNNLLPPTRSECDVGEPRKRGRRLSSNSSVDTSSHNHLLESICSSPRLQSWLHECWALIPHRHERIAVGVLSVGIAVLTRERMEMHIKHAPDIRGILDCLPVAARPEIGFRQKLPTWPMSKHEEVKQKLGTWPLLARE
jgi:hypothetical protein